jgi:hypothetical protein
VTGVNGLVSVARRPLNAPIVRRATKPASEVHGPDPIDGCGCLLPGRARPERGAPFASHRVASRESERPPFEGPPVSVGRVDELHENASWGWAQLRAMRSAPPGLASNDLERSDVFTSSLEQAEQLCRAATVTPPAARPLPLFYAMSQATRAVAAVALPENWTPRTHGLSLPNSDEPILERKLTTHVNAGAGFSAAARSDPMCSPTMSP